MLVLGKTYFITSEERDVMNCTGGILERDQRMVRIRPIDWIGLDSGKKPRDFHWVRCRVQQDPNDSRPESLLIDVNSIQDDGQLSDPAERAGVLERCTHYVQSLEALQDLQEAESRSLGIIEPKEMLGCRVVLRTEREREDWQAREKRRLSQGTLIGSRPFEIDFPEARFKVSWRCRDQRCGSHEMDLKDLGLHMLWRKLEQDPEREKKVREEMEQRLDLRSRRVFLFLGNLITKRYQFILAGAAPVKKVEPTLFG